MTSAALRARLDHLYTSLRRNVPRIKVKDRRETTMAEERTARNVAALGDYTEKRRDDH